MCTCMCVHVRYNVHMYHSCTTHVAIITTAYMYDTFTCIICMWYSCPLYKIDIYLCRVTTTQARNTYTILESSQYR